MDRIDKLFKTNPIKGNFCELHHVDINDAQLIFDLRTKRNNSFLKKTNGTLEEQKKYLESYLKDWNKKEQIYYKIFDTKKQKFSGVLRLTEINNTTNFNWQSFVVFEGTTPNTPIDAMLMVYRIGFEYLGRTICGPWEVDREFTKMIKIHTLLNMARVVDNNEKYFFYAVNSKDYFNNISKYLKMNYANLGGLL